MKLQKAIFYFVSNLANCGSELGDLEYSEDFHDFLIENSGIKIKMELSVAREKQDKDSMYEYYHKVVLGVAISCFTDQGWEAMDKVKADYFLKNECAKDIVYNPKMDKQVIFLEDKSKMTKARLHKFISDCITYLEQEHNARVPDSEQYRLANSNEKGFIPIK